jgi:hypothetical protein
MLLARYSSENVMRFYTVVFYLSFFVFVSCSPLKVNGDQTPTHLLIQPGTPHPNNLSTPQTTETIINPPTATAEYSIPSEKARIDAQVQSSLPISEATNLSDKEIALLLFNKMLSFKESKDVDINRIVDFQIEKILYGDNGSLYACYIVKPSSDTLYINNGGNVLDNGRIRICYHFQVVKDNDVYKLLGPFSGP